MADAAPPPPPQDEERQPPPPPPMAELVFFAGAGFGVQVNDANNGRPNQFNPVDPRLAAPQAQQNEQERAHHHARLALERGNSAFHSHNFDQQRLWQPFGSNGPLWNPFGHNSDQQRSWNSYGPHRQPCNPHGQPLAQQLHGVLYNPHGQLGETPHGPMYNPYGQPLGHLPHGPPYNPHGRQPLGQPYYSHGQPLAQLPHGPLYNPHCQPLAQQLHGPSYNPHGQPLAQPPHGQVYNPHGRQPVGQPYYSHGQPLAQLPHGPLYNPYGQPHAQPPHGQVYYPHGRQPVGQPYYSHGQPLAQPTPGQLWHGKLYALNEHGQPPNPTEQQYKSQGLPAECVLSATTHGHSNVVRAVEVLTSPDDHESTEAGEGEPGEGNSTGDPNSAPDSFLTSRLEGGFESADGGNAEDHEGDGAGEEFELEDLDPFDPEGEENEWEYMDRLVKPLFEAIQGGQPLSVLKAIVERRPESVQTWSMEESCFALQVAVMHGSPLSHVKFLYDKYPEAIINERVRNLALHYITDETPVEVVEFLVDMYPVALLVKDGQGRLPIHFGFRCSDAIARLLAERCPESLSVRDEDGCLPIHLAATREEPHQPEVKVVECIVDMYPQALLVKDGDGNLPIHLAMEACSLDELQLLVERCPISLLAPDSHGYLPIHRAATCSRNPQQLQLLRYLAHSQSIPASLLQRTEDDDADGYLPIHLAATEEGKGPQQLEVIQFLAQACPESLGTFASGSLPVHEALQSNVMPGVVQLLVGLLPESIPEETRLCLLHFSIRVGAPGDNMKELVKALPASLQTRDSEGSLPIHVAADAASREVGMSMSDFASRLATDDPASLLVPNADGDLPLHIAIIRSDLYIDQPHASTFLKRGPEAARVKRRNGNLAIHDATERRMYGMVREITRRVPETASSVDAAGRSPLHVAAAVVDGANSIKRFNVQFLAYWSPDSLLVPDLNGDLPLQLAILSSSENDSTVEIVTILLDECPQSVREVGAGGKLPLHLAVSKSPPSLPLVRLLINRWLGALAVLDAEGKSPMHVAVSMSSPSFPLVQLLVESRTETLEKRDAEGNVPLILAAANETASLDLIYWLARAKPDLVAPRPNGRDEAGHVSVAQSSRALGPFSPPSKRGRHPSTAGGT